MNRNVLFVLSTWAAIVWGDRKEEGGKQATTEMKKYEKYLSCKISRAFFFFA